MEYNNLLSILSKIRACPDFIYKNELILFLEKILNEEILILNAKEFERDLVVTKEKITCLDPEYSLVEYPVKIALDSKIYNYEQCKEKYIDRLRYLYKLWR